MSGAIASAIWCVVWLCGAGVVAWAAIIVLARIVAQGMGDTEVDE